MDPSRTLAAYLLYRRRRILRQRYQSRRHWVHPINKRRDEVGIFSTIFEELKQDKDQFFNFFRMSLQSFEELLAKIKDSITAQNTNMRNAISPELRLAITLRYLASGCTFADLHFIFRIGISTASVIVRSVCKAIWNKLKAEELPVPTKDMWKAIAQKFETRANFAHCTGAVDGKHIRIMCPRKSGSMYYNYKRYHSIVLMAIVDADYKFVYVDIGSYGKDGDCSIFQRSKLGRLLENGSIDLPNDECLPGTTGLPVPYVFVADEAFGIRRYMVRPYGGRNLSIIKRIFNYRLSRARRFVECAFGILSNKWRILHRAINVEPDFAIDIIKCCAILHNFVLARHGLSIEDTMTITGLEDIHEHNQGRGPTSANEVRNQFSQYFVSTAGAVPWQINRI